MTPDSYVQCHLESVDEVEHCENVRIFNFRLPSRTSLTFNAGQHLVAREKDIIRPYTLISQPGKALTAFQVLIKLYEDGPMSRIIRDKWEPGWTVSWRGPLGGLNYRANVYRDVVLIGAGTGITPLYQLARIITDNPEDETRVRLIYCCRTYGEILLRRELHEMQSFWNFTVRYFLSRDVRKEAEGFRKHNEDVTYSRLTEEELLKEIPSALLVSGKSNVVKVFLCGPKPFESHVMNWLDKVMDKSLIETF